MEELFLTEGDVELYEEDGAYHRVIGHISDGWIYEIGAFMNENNTMYRLLLYNDEILSDWYYTVDYRSSGHRPRLCIAPREARQVFDYAGINVPVKTGETYRDWCRVMQIDRIKENNLQPEERDGIFGIWKEDVLVCGATLTEGSCERWVFSTEWYQGIYSEYDNGGGVRTCIFDFSKPSGYGAREEWPIRSVAADISADGIIERIEYMGWPIAE